MLRVEIWRQLTNVDTRKRRDYHTKKSFQKHQFWHKNQLILMSKTTNSCSKWIYLNLLLMRKCEREKKNVVEKMCCLVLKCRDDKNHLNDVMCSSCWDLLIEKKCWNDVLFDVEILWRQTSSEWCARVIAEIKKESRIALFFWFCIAWRKTIAARMRESTLTE